MRLSIGRGQTPIGVDLGARNVKAMQLSHRGGNWHVKAAAFFPRTGEADRIDASTVDHLSDVLYRRGFKGNNVVLAAPDDLLRTSILELPSGGPNIPLHQIARVEMSRMHKLDPQSFEMACWVLPQPDRSHKMTHVMAAACPHEEANGVLDVLEERGLSVRALDVSACALARANDSVAQGDDSIVAILDLGWRAARLVVMHGRVISYERKLVGGGLRSIHKALTAQLGDDAEVAEHVLNNVGLMSRQDDAEQDAASNASVRRIIAGHFEAMLNELLASLSYTSQQYSQAALDSVLLVGAGASVPGLSEYLETMLSAKVRPISPADLVDCPPSLLQTCRDPEMTLAMGLALFAA